MPRYSPPSPTRRGELVAIRNNRTSAYRTRTTPRTDRRLALIRWRVACPSLNCEDPGGCSVCEARPTDRARRLNPGSETHVQAEINLARILDGGRAPEERRRHHA